MIVKVEICYEDAARNKKVDVGVSAGLKGTRLMRAIDGAVNKKLKDDKDWNRWNLIDIEE